MSQDSDIPMAGAIHDNDADSQAENVKSAFSPGELLHRARESLNLTISDLAGQTRLSRNVLEALEKNDFASLAMPVYVRGYLRKCAHVLNISEDKLLQAYADWTGMPLKAQPLPVTVNEPPREYASPARTPSWRYVLVIAVVCGAVLWWFGSGEEIAQEARQETAVPITTLEMAEPVLETQSLPVPAGETTGTADSLASPSVGMVTAPNDAGAVAGAAPEAPSSAATTVITNEPRIAAPPPGPNTLQLNISKTSWVEVYDDDRKRLLYGLLTPGTEQRLNGKPPYEVVLGHPQGVKLSIGGKAIDLGPHTSGNGTARFEVERP